MNTMVDSQRMRQKGSEAGIMPDKLKTRNTLFEVLYLLTMSAALISVTLLPSFQSTAAFPLKRIQRSEGIILTGTVAAVEHGKYLTALTVRSGGSRGTDRFPHVLMKVFINPNTMVTMCNVSMHAKDIKARSPVIITYHKVRGLAVADSVSGQC